MIKKELKISIDKSMLQQLLSENEEFMKPLIQSVVQEVLEAQMSAALGADKGERTAERLGYRSGYYTRWLITRVGRIELRVPQGRQGRFSTEVFERYQRSEKAARLSRCMCKGSPRARSRRWPSSCVDTVLARAQ